MATPVLFQLPPALGLLSFSPYCAKVQLALKLKGFSYEVKNLLAVCAAQVLGRRKLGAGEARVRAGLPGVDALETRLSGRRFLCGDSITIADVSVAAMLAQLDDAICPAEAAELRKRTKLSALVREVFQEAAARAAR